MNKLPVFRTFGRAIAFAFGNFFTIFRLSWFPLAVFIATNLAVGIYVQQGLLGSKPMIDPFSIQKHIGDFLFVNVLMMILEAITFAAVAVSIHRVILFGGLIGVMLSIKLGPCTHIDQNEQGIFVVILL